MRRTARPDRDLGSHIDLVPLIDCVFLLLLFFMLCGRLAREDRPEQISVPPARTAVKATADRPRVVINVRDGRVPALRFGPDGAWLPLRDGEGWVAVRQRLDAVWDRAVKLPLGGVDTADAVIEIRADGDVPYAVVQRLQAVCAGTVDPATLLPRRAAERPFCVLDFTARPAG